MADKFQLKAIISAVDRLTPTLQGIQKVAAKTKLHLSSIGGAVSNLAGRIGVPLGLITAAVGGASLAGLKGAVDQYAQLGAGLDDAAKRTGLAAGELQRLNYLATMSDVSVEGLHGAIGRLSLGLGQAASGKNKELAALFAKLKIDPRNVKSATDILPKLADAFQRNTSQMARARMGTALFGKSYAELLPLLVDGSEGIAAAFKRWDEIGMPLSDEDLAAAAEYADKLDDLKFAGQGLSTVVGRQLLPVLTPVIESLIQWTVQNRAWLATNITKAIQSFVSALATVDWAGLVQKVKGVFGAIGSFVDMIGGGRNALIALAVVLNAGAIIALGQLAVALFSASKAALLFTIGLGPIAWGAIAVAAAAFLIIKNWDTVKAWFTKFFDWIGEKWKALTGWIGDMVSAAGRFLGLGGGDGAGAKGGSVAAAARPNLVTGGSRMSAAVSVDFNNAPPGLRVQPAQSSNDLFLATNVGYRTLGAN